MISAATSAGNLAVPAIPRQRIALQPYTGPRDFDGQRAMAEFWAGAGDSIPPLYRGSPGDVFNAIQTGIAFDLQPSIVMHHFFYDRASGRGGMSAVLMHGLLNRAGHQLEVLDSNRRVCRMLLTRGDGLPGGPVEWTAVEAAAAGISGETFERYAADTLWARCTSRACRRYAPEVVVGYGYALEELASIVPDPSDAGDTQAERPVSEPVQEFLTPLEGASHEQIVKAWTHARSKAGKGLALEYAGRFDGRELTVDQVLQRWGLEAARRERQVDNADRAQRVDTSAVEVVTAQLATAVQLAAEAAAAPAGEDPDDDLDDLDATLGCGCRRAAYVAAGEHVAEGCTELAKARQ